MNKVKYIFLAFIFCISCKDAKEQEEKAKFQKKLDTQLASGIRNDTIFLGYTFGMTEKEFVQKTKELRNEKKLYVNEKRNLAYKMTVDDSGISEAEATFSPEYFNDRLYKLGVSVNSSELNVPFYTQMQLVDLFMDKYGYDYQRLKNGKGENDYNFIWVQGNRKIEIIKGVYDARIFYTDILAEKKATEEKLMIKNQKLSETTNDI